MKSKVLKYSAYFFGVCLLTYFILTQVTNPPHFVDTLQIICLILAFLVILLYLFIFIFCYIDNKKIAKMLDLDQYDEILKYCNIMLKKKIIFLGERKAYYTYLLILSYVGKDDYNNFIILFEKFKYKDEYSMIYYWRACFEFSKLNFTEVDMYIKKFYETFNKKNKLRYLDIFNVLQAINLYLENKKEEAIELINKVDTQKISMPSTHRCISFIKNEKENENKL